MHAYEDLIPPYRALVERMVTEAAAEGWDVVRAYLASLFAALTSGQARHPAIDPEADLAWIIAGLVERLGEPEIRSRLQAGIYAISAKPEHRWASQEWFDRNPEEYEAIQQELAEGGVRLN